MKITAIETLWTEAFANVLWVRVLTSAGLIGHGETFYGAGAIEEHIHNTITLRLLGRDPLRIEALNREILNLPMAQASTGVETRAASAIDIALWDILGKLCDQPVHQMPDGRCRDRPRVYNTCAFTTLEGSKGLTAPRLLVSRASWRRRRQRARRTASPSRDRPAAALRQASCRMARWRAPR